MVAPKGNDTNEPTVVRDLVSALGVRAVSLYTTTKDASPTVLKSTFSSVENLLTPYQEPIQTKWKEHADPILSKLDATIAEKIVPQAKAVEDSVYGAVSKSEEYWKASVQLAHDKVSQTEEYIERVTDQVIRPYQQKVMASTEEYTKQVADVAKRNKGLVEQKTKDTLTSLVARADTAIDYVLPEVDHTASAPAPAPATAPQAEPAAPAVVEETSRLASKIADRLQKRVTKVYQYSAERAQQIVHIDLIAYAKETLGADEAKIAKAFDKVISLLPTPEATAKVADKVVKKLPANVQPVASQGASLITPLVNTALATLTTFIFFIRTYFVAPTPASTPAATPAPTTSKTPTPAPVQAAAPNAPSDARHAEAAKPADDTVHAAEHEQDHDSDAHAHAATSASRKKRSAKNKKTESEQAPATTQLEDAVVA